MSRTPILELREIRKEFPSVVANDRVSFSIADGEVHALLGENGAGKSTLVKMIYGVMQPDSGSMLFQGEPYAPTKPSDARARGIGMVFQHFSLFEALTVAENIALGLGAQAAREHLADRIVEISSSYGLKVDPARLVGTLSVGERQRVEIVRCLLQNPKLLIMDEPTSVLTPQEVGVLFGTLRRLAEEGCAILYISHKLEEIRSLCHKATILRGGRLVGSCDPTQQTVKGLAEMMIGQTLQPPERAHNTPGAVRFAVKGLSLASEEQFGTDLHDINFEVRAGEILGIAGVAGNGQIELMEALIGECPAPEASQIRLNGDAVGNKGPKERRALGMAFVPEERLGHAAVPGMALWENTFLAAAPCNGLVRKGFLDIRRARALASKIISDLQVKAGGVHSAARSLSGGNLQKFVMGREILQTPQVLIASQPTWGVDAGAAAVIHTALLELARAGAALVIISQDLDELFAVSSSIAVISGGHLLPPEPTGSVTIEHIGRSMGASSTSAGAAHA